MWKFRSEIWYSYKVQDANELSMHDACWVNSPLAHKTAVQSVFHWNRVNWSYSYSEAEGVCDTAATNSVVKHAGRGNKANKY